VNERHYTNDDGVPAGGHTEAKGLSIRWQNGPLREQDGTEHPRNGAFVEEVIMAALGRLRYYQKSKFACEENAQAILSLESAMYCLETRTRNRKARHVEGTSQT
jgi:hypothetical protein